MEIDTMPTKKAKNKRKMIKTKIIKMQKTKFK